MMSLEKAITLAISLMKTEIWEYQAVAGNAQLHPFLVADAKAKIVQFNEAIAELKKALEAVKVMA